jgi:hypothetical protein
MSGSDGIKSELLASKTIDWRTAAHSLQHRPLVGEPADQVIHHQATPISGFSAS